MTILKPWPEHQNPNQMRTAHAPYNFVPLPEKIISAVDSVDDLPDHDGYDRTLHSGYFDVTLTTRSPLYIRGPVPAKDFPRQEQDSLIKNKPEFFHTGDERTPVIPSSSLRGMLRGLLEIVSYGKMQWVSEKQLFFRTVDRTAIGEYYTHRMVEDLGSVQSNRYPSAPGYRARVEGGFFHKRKDGTYFIEECTVARVDTSDLLRLFGLADRRELYELNGQNLHVDKERNPNQTPKWLYQHREIWADIDGTENDYFFPKQSTPDRKRVRHPDFYLRFQRARNLAITRVQNKQSGKLILTGHMNFKHLAFLFAPLGGSATRIEVRNDPMELDSNKRLVDRFHDNDQLTQWQIKAFPANRSLAAQMEGEDGHLRDGDPVFFLRDENQEIVFFGRAQMFRIPYTQRPIDLVPRELRQTKDIDYAEALFGFVRTRQQLTEMGANIPKQGDKSRAYAGRVTVTDGHLLEPDQKDIWLGGDFDQEIRPRILATPKPTSFQQYLTQQHPNDQKNLNHYDSNLSGSEKTAIRGHKLYWHQSLDTDQGFMLKQIEEHTQKINPLDTQHTRFKPLKPGVQFSFRVHFENLSDRELGALYWTLHPQGEPERRYCHHLGMGKPLGMGTVELHASLHIINRMQRYRTLFSGDNWQLGESVTNESSSKSILPPEGASEMSVGKDPAVSGLLDRATQSFEEHLLRELNPEPPCTRLSDMLRIAILLKLLEWPNHPAVQNDTHQFTQPLPPDTSYMDFGDRDRRVLPDPTQFDKPYFKDKSRPQGTHVVDQEQTRAKEDATRSTRLSEVAEEYYIGRDLRNMVNFTQTGPGIEVRLWNRDPTQTIGFIPKELVDRELGNKISVIVTGLHQETNGRIVVELKLRPKR